MIYERVNFNAEVIKTMSRDDFIERHVGILWQDRHDATRRKMLGEVYDKINPNVTRAKKK